MRRKQIVFGVAAIVGILIFTTIVIVLSLLQPGYNPLHQHISELAYGRYGSLMVIAFAGLAVAVVAVLAGLHVLGSSIILEILLITAAGGFFGAGIFRLDTSPVLHVGSIALTFVMMVTAMYLLPRLLTNYQKWSDRLVSWGLGASITLSVAFSGEIPHGIAQRLATTGILVWIVWTALSIIGYREATRKWKS